MESPLADLDYGTEEDQAVLDVLHSKWLTMGASPRRSSRSSPPSPGYSTPWPSPTPPRPCTWPAWPSGIGPGDEVIVPSLTFVATANAVLYTGAERASPISSAWRS